MGNKDSESESVKGDGEFSVSVKVQKLINSPALRHESKYFVKIKVIPLSFEEEALSKEETANSSNSSKSEKQKTTKPKERKFVHWVPDYAVSKCADCAADFRAYRRRHHCRYCGNVFCGSCSSHFLLLPEEFELPDEERVCKSCYDELKPLQEYLRLLLGKEEGYSIPLLGGRYSNDVIKKIPKFFVYKTDQIAVKDDDGFSVSWEDSGSIQLGWLTKFFSTVDEDKKRDMKKDALLHLTLFQDGQVIGYTEVTASYLAEKSSRDLLLTEYNTEEAVVRSKSYMPILLRVSAVFQYGSAEEIKAQKENFNEIAKKETRKHTCPKHVFMITRGTRGDVQPFVALARALAEQFGWRVTLITELRYKDFVKSHSKVSNGYIDFRPSGGDTQQTVDSKLGKWAISLESDYMNTIMLSMNEVQFFSSEPAIYYWTKTMRPDCLIFGFTMAAVTMTASEALGIPLIGFNLQPTCIPSKRFPPILPLDEKVCARISANTFDADAVDEDGGTQVKEGNESKVAREKSGLRPHHIFNHLKEFMENNPLTQHLNTMRKRRSLVPYSRRQEGRNMLVNVIGALGWPTTNKTWRELTKKNVPLVIPINEMAFGGKPEKWSENTVFTDNIFLRGNTVPELTPELQSFIDNAKANGRKLIALAFSSMPVGITDIMKIAVTLIEGAEKPVSVVALSNKYRKTVKGSENVSGDDESVSKQDIENNTVLLDIANTAKKLKKKLEIYKGDGRLFVDKGAPFGKLFCQMDAVVTHGGLGSTGEAIMSQAPVIVTGVLLFDQRFWGVRCHEMGIGPFPVHINKFRSKCVAIIDEAIQDDSVWKKNAIVVGQKMKDYAQDDPSGTIRNAQAIYDMVEKAFPYKYNPPPNPLASVVDAAMSIPRNFSRGTLGSNSSTGNSDRQNAEENAEESSVAED